jgi:DnaJ-class molecular chaperone
MFSGETRLKAAIDAYEYRQLRYRRVRCKICHGTGIDTNGYAMGVRCEKCEGTGWRLFPEGPTETCSSCSGRGKDYRFNRKGTACQDCDGFGEVKLL